MATNGWIIDKTVDLTKPPKTFRPEAPYEIFYSGDEATPVWRVHVEENGQPVTLNGTIAVYMNRSDGMIVYTEGFIYSNNVCEVRLGSYDFGRPGYASAIMRYTDYRTNATVTLDAITFMIQSDPAGGSIIDKDSVLPQTIDQLVAQIETMREATGAANDAADHANEVADGLEDATLETQRRVLAAFPVDTASGEFVSIPDGADNLPIKQMQVAIKPVQDLHGYDYPWPAGGGKNLLDMNIVSQTKHGITATVNDDGSIMLSGQSTSVGEVYFDLNYTAGVLSMPTGVLLHYGAYVDKTPSGITMQLCKSNYSQALTLNAGFNISNSYTFSNDTTVNWLRLKINENATINNVTIYPFWCLASNIMTEWEPCSNICPITGWTGAKVQKTGKNLIKYPYLSTTKTMNGITFTDNGDGTIITNGTSTANADFTLWENNAFSMLSGDYIFTCEGLPTSCYIAFGGAAPSVKPYVNIFGSMMPYRFTLSNDGPVGYGVMRIQNAVTLNNVTLKPMIRLATETDAIFEPYAGNTYNITFPASAGTVYGGTLTINEDGSGNLVVDKGYRTITQAYSVGTATYGNYAIILPYVDCKEVGEGVYAQNLLCDVYKPVTRSSDRVPWSIYIINKAIVVTNPNFTSVDAASAILSEQRPTLIYNLATPTTYPLTAEQVTTLLGTNNISADTGEIITLDYRADVTKYIAKKLAEL